MEEAKLELVQQWLQTASRDLVAARALAHREPVVREVAVYHCQQAAEKAVKAFLVFKDYDPERTHDVDRLLELAMRWEPAFVASRSAGRRLTPYATLYRYPGDILKPSSQQTDTALNDAICIYNQVLSHLPGEIHSHAEPDSGGNGDEANDGK
jgi:HEPN domain-containing protein